MFSEAMAKWGHAFAGLLGIAATIAWSDVMTGKRMVLAAASGAVLVFWGTPVAMAFFTPHLPVGVSVDVIWGLAGLTGAAMGAFGVFVVSGLLTIAQKFSTDPWWVIDKLRGKNGNAD